MSPKEKRKKKKLGCGYLTLDLPVSLDPFMTFWNLASGNIGFLWYKALDIFIFYFNTWVYRGFISELIYILFYEFNSIQNIT